MKVIFVSHSATQSAITVKLHHNDNYGDSYEIHLFNDNGTTERHSVAYTLEEALTYHRYLCEKCNIRVNV